ncbi:MAG TPA: HPF/RaiA family ribosome-associated protein [Kofleriaceae bacterium]|jgi:ribosome-associated translation inhibitor RaiA|nr:HPF/RaiA family ribosome-associated protein [Kofleriaceae bacterium]
MDIQIRHDDNLPGDINDRMVPIVEDVLERYRHQITTLEVHLADENGPKRADGDIRCTIEARVENRQPTAVTARANDVYTAVNAAAKKMLRKLDTELGKLRDQSVRGPA